MVASSNISADAARAFATQIGYGVSKTALETLTRSFAIAPGPVQTGYTDAAVLPTILLRQLGRPEDIAHAALFLASAQAEGYYTGHVLRWQASALPAASLVTIAGSSWC